MLKHKHYAAVLMALLLVACGDPIINFTASKTSIAPGETITLAWSVTNIDTVPDVSINLEPGFGAVGAEGNVAVNPSQDTVYTLTVSGTFDNVYKTFNQTIAIDVVGIVDHIPPTAVRPAYATSIDSSTGTVAWIASTDNITTAEALSYSVHIGDTADFTPNASNLNAQVIGITETEITGLLPSTEYYAKIVATDEQNNNSLAATEATQAIKLTTGDLAFEYREDFDFLLPEELFLGSYTQDGNQVTFVRQFNSIIPSTGAIILLGDELALIENVTPTFTTVVLEVSDVPLNNIIKNGHIKLRLTPLDDLNLENNLEANAANISEGPDNTVQVNVVNNGLTLQSLYPLEEDEEEEPVHKVGITPIFEFDPEFDHDIKFEEFELKSAMFASTGTLLSGVKADFQLQKNQAPYEKEKEYPKFTKSKKIKIKLPVKKGRSITFTIKMEMKLKSKVVAGSGEQNFTGSVFAQDLITYDYTMNYEKDSGTTHDLTEFTLEPEVDVSVHAHANVTASISLIPEIIVTVNSLSYVKTEFDFGISGVLQLENTPIGLTTLFGPLQFQKIDFFLGADCTQSFGLKAFGIDIPFDEDKRNCGEKIKLFGLSELDTSYTESIFDCKNLDLEAEVVKDGPFNPFDLASARWFTVTNGSTVVDAIPNPADPENKLKALAYDQFGEYPDPYYFSGYDSVAGPISTRYIKMGVDSVFSESEDFYVSYVYNNCDINCKEDQLKKIDLGNLINFTGPYYGYMKENDISTLCNTLFEHAANFTDGFNPYSCLENYPMKTSIKDIPEWHRTSCFMSCTILDDLGTPGQMSRNVGFNIHRVCPLDDLDIP